MSVSLAKHSWNSRATPPLLIPLNGLQTDVVSLLLAQTTALSSSGTSSTNTTPLRSYQPRIPRVHPPQPLSAGPQPHGNATTKFPTLAGHHKGGPQAPAIHATGLASAADEEFGASLCNQQGKSCLVSTRHAHAICRSSSFLLFAPSIRLTSNQGICLMHLILPLISRFPSPTPRD